MKTFFAVTMSVLCVLLSMACTPSDTAGSTETTNQFVAGMLYEPDGITPAKDATVIIRPKNSLPLVAGVVTDKLNGSIDTVLTNDKGRYGFSRKLAAGSYSIEAHKDGNAVFISSVDVNDSEEPVAVAPDTLKPTGTLTGGVFLAGGGDPTEVYVLAFGCDRFTLVKDDGTFRLTGLGEGEYRLKIITTLDNYTSFDTAGIAVVSADTTDLGTIALPFNGVPMLQHINVAWDTVECRATISWNKTGYESVNYYNIYRWGIYDDTITPLDYMEPPKQVQQVNQYQVTDTFYVDSIGGFTGNARFGLGTPLRLLYFVAIVDSSEREGLYSPAGIVEPVQSFIVVHKVDIRSQTNGCPQDFCMTRDGTVLAASSEHATMSFLDAESIDKGKFLVVPPQSEVDTATALSYIPVAICCDRQSDRYYFVRPDEFIIDIYRNKENAGIFIDSITDPTITTQGVTDCEVIDGRLYVLTGGDSLLCFDSSGERIYARYCGDLGTGKCLADGGAGRVVVGIRGAICNVCRYDGIGNRLSTSNYNADSLISIAIDTIKQHCYILSQETYRGLYSEAKLEVFDSDDIKIGRYLFVLRGHYFTMGHEGIDVVFLSGYGDPQVVFGTTSYTLNWSNSPVLFIP